MKTPPKPTSTSESVRISIWTIGHSNRSVETFLELLKKHDIELLVDVRSFPTSKVEHFKRKEMERWLPDNRIEYVWLGKELGGYRRGGYKVHMRTTLFKDGVERLLKIAEAKRTCIMCMEPNPNYCHRRHLSAYLERKRARVVHIIGKGQMVISRFSSEGRRSCELSAHSGSITFSPFPGLSRSFLFSNICRRTVESSLNIVFLNPLQSFS